MTGYATLIKYALWSALIIICAGFVWWMASTIHDNIYNDGRAVERAEWLGKEEKRNSELAEAIVDASQALAAEREKQTNALTEALQNEITAKNKLHNDIDTIRRANRGLWIDAKNCANQATGKSSDENQSASIGDGGTGRVRLPEEIEFDLWKYSEDAQKVVIQYNTCRKTLAPYVEVIPDDS